MISIIQNTEIKNPVFFIHGAYQSPIMWNFLFDDFINYSKPYDCVFLSLPCYYQPLEDNSVNKITEDIFCKIKPVLDKVENVTIVGHSLGAIIAVRLLSMIKNTNVSLFLSSMPLFLPKKIMPLRMLIEKIIFKISNKFPREIIPRTLRPKLLTNYHEYNILEEILTIDLQNNFQENIDVVKNVHIACGVFDFLSGGINTQLRLVHDIQKMGINAQFTNLGFCGHYPQIFSKNKYFKWLIKNL